jgi:phage protein U
MNGIMMLLGPFRFSLSTSAYESLTRDSKWSWQSIDRIGAMPMLQYTGPENDTISLSGKIMPGFFGGIEQVPRMRVLADQGKPLFLVDGRGLVHGNWVIESVSETGRFHYKDGVPRLIEFSMTLKKYSDGKGIVGVATKISKVISLFG